MANNKTLELSIKIAGKMDKSLMAALNGSQSQISNFARSICHPYSSWERGSNENANSMIRRRHPKGTDFSKVSAAEIAATEEWINNYPRKILGYKSSEVMFRECLREIGLIA